MTATFQIKRRVNGATGSPATAGMKEGELALNFPGAAGTTTKPELWAFDGTGWRRVNPDSAVTVGNIALPGGTAGSATGIGAAYNTFTPKPTTAIVIATYAGSAYILTGAGTADGDWAALGSATAFASDAEVLAGTDTAKAINSARLRGATLQAPTGGAGPVAGDINKIPRLGSLGTIDDRFIPKLVSTDRTVLQAGAAINAFLTAAGLRAATVNVSAGAADAAMIPRLDATGKIDATMLPANATHLAGAVDPTAVPPTGVTTGAMYFANKDGVINAGFTGITAGTVIKTSDALIYDGTSWHHIPNGTDLSAYVPLAGTNLMSGNIVYSGAAGSKAGVVIYNGKGGTLDNVLLDAGTY